jgi:hypothetical protein
VTGVDGRSPVVMAMAARRSYDQHRPVRLDEIEQEVVTAATARNLRGAVRICHIARRRKSIVVENLDAVVANRPYHSVKGRDFCDCMDRRDFAVPS